MKTMRQMKKVANKQLLMLSFLLLSIAIIGCRDIIEKDITKSQVSINSPEDGAQSVVYNQLFWWNLLDGATQYSIQIATPSFDAVQSIVSDTIIKGDKFYKTLAPGKYQWRIRAENGAYKSNYQTYSLTMNQSALNLQTVQLSAPANNVYQKTNLFNFAWVAVPGATKYIIQIDTVSMNFTSPLKLDSTSNTTYSYTFSGQGDYKWRVMAKDNSSNQTNWSDIYYTGYSTTAPAVPIPASPANLSTVTPSTVTFSWNAVTRAKTYTLYLYRNNADTAVASTESYSVNSPSKSVSFTGVNSGAIIYWRVSASDIAGNESARSIPTRKITVQ
jgi:hypothetical protein